MIRQYFTRWIDALCAALVRAGASIETAAAISEEAVGGIQGGLILSRALNDEPLFERTLAGLAERVTKFLREALIRANCKWYRHVRPPAMRLKFNISLNVTSLAPHNGWLRSAINTIHS
jgi:hypothetical protein